MHHDTLTKMGSDPHAHTIDRPGALYSPGIFRHHYRANRSCSRGKPDAEAVEKRPSKEAPVRAITAGIQSLLDTFTPDVEEQLRTRLRIVADNPELAAAAIHSNDETIAAIATALTVRGVDKLTATALATAVIAGLTRALIDWSTHINRPLMPTLRGVLHALAGAHA